jgi:hypothetical protein
VHFNAVTERFAPHDTEFSIGSAKELRDTTLSAACSLHTASGSTSSSTSSLRRRRLMEIAEDEEEDLRAKRQSTVPEERPSTAKTISASDAPPTTDLPELPGLTPSISYLSSPEDDSFPPPREPYSPTRSIGEGRKSFQSTRPEIYTSASHGSSGRPKVKLGPRPSLDVGGRPHASEASSIYRPVSTLPAGMKLFGKAGSKKEKDRPQSLHPAAEMPTMTLSPPSMQNSTLVPSQDALVRPHTSGGRPQSSHSMKPLISPSAPTFPKTPTITPEKARLLRAMELRKKQQSAIVMPDPVISEAPVEGEEVTSHTNQKGALPEDIHETLSTSDDTAKGDDSGIAFDTGSTVKTDDSDATRSDSCPVSPVGPSEHPESTKASSISDSTDETIQEPSPSAANDIPDKGSVLDDDVPGPETSHEIGETVEIGASDLELISPESKRESLQKLYPTTYNPNHTPENPVEEPSPVVNVPAAIEEEHASHDDIEEIAIPEPTPQLSEDAPKLLPALTPDEEVKTVTPEDIVEQISESSSSTTDEPESESQPESSPPQALPLPPIQTTQAPADESTSEELVDQTPPTRTWKVPRSKFSVQDLRAEAEVPAVPTEPLPKPSAAIIPPPEKSPVESTFSTDTKRFSAEDERSVVGVSKRKKRRGLVEPIRTDIDRSGANSEANFSSDDDLMDELQSAVFQEAKPISVSKSPISPVFPSPKRQTIEPSRFSRTVSNPIKKEGTDSQMLELPTSKVQPGPTGSVRAGAAFLNRINQQAPKPVPKKVSLGSGISQRIKALEKLSSSAPNATPVGTIAPNSGASTAFFSVRKASTRSSSRSPSVAERADSLTRHTPSPSSSPETSKLRERSGSVKSRLDAFRSNPVSLSQSGTQPGRARPESVSVTARIIRDPAQPFPALPQAGKDPTDYAPLDLKQSPLVIDHQKAIPDPQKDTLQDRRNLKERRLSNASRTTATTTTTERRSSIAVIKDLISDGRASFSERRRSINLDPASSLSTPSIISPSRPPSVHHSPSRRPSSVSSRRNSRDLAAGFSPPPTAGSLSSTSDDRSEKKSTRASRMLRRMSSSLSAGRKTIAHAMSPTVREESEPVPGLDFQSSTSSRPSNAPTTPTNTSVGDVNVQFPDSLLWKRRSMLLDSAGYLILSPALTAHGNGKQAANVGATRKFHMSEFRTPAIPDVEMQELPNSVVLDFIEGGGLQVACEDRTGQKRVLKSMHSIPLYIQLVLIALQHSKKHIEYGPRTANDT